MLHILDMELQIHRTGHDVIGLMRLVSIRWGLLRSGQSIQPCWLNLRVDCTFPSYTFGPTCELIDHSAHSRCIGILTAINLVAQKLAERRHNAPLVAVTWPCPSLWPHVSRLLQNRLRYMLPTTLHPEVRFPLHARLRVLLVVL